LRYKVVIDTNILLVSISEKSSIHWIFQLIIENEIDVYLTNDIFIEYEEIVIQKMGSEAFSSFFEVIKNLNNIYFIDTYFKFNLLLDDDDNKFVDCAIASNADFILTEDKDFNVLKQIQFPKVNVLSISQFESLLL
jgi:putative PIN family toxin of toxin-antitoxin system